MHFRNIIILVLLCLVFYLPGLKTIPPLDRDESRFAQASKQMIESGDYIDIRFQKTARYKKPAGAYWLQAASVNLLSPNIVNSIWAYRIPSLVAATISVIVTYFIASIFIKPIGALTAGIVLATSLLLIAEAHMAKSDALLLMSLVISQFGLAKAYKNNFTFFSWLCLWAGIGLGILVKGPIVPLIILLTIFGIWALDRDIAWCRCLKPIAGLSIVAIISLPWIIAVQIRSDGAFLQHSIGVDLIPKLLGGIESHGLPPGYYLLAVMCTFWPGSLFLWPALCAAFGSRTNLGSRFLLAWLIPPWILLELVPTKLPHYVLPIYPAVAIMVGSWLAKVDSGRTIDPSGFQLKTFVNILLSVFWLIIGVVFIISAMLLGVDDLLTPDSLKDYRSILERVYKMPLAIVEAPILIASSVTLLAILVTLVFYTRRVLNYALAFSIFASALVTIPLLQWTIPGVKWLFPSNQIYQVLENKNSENNTLVAVGYHEPSLVFLGGTKTYLTEPREAARLLAQTPGARVLVTGVYMDAFLKSSKIMNIKPKVIHSFKSFNYSKGRPLELHVLVTQ
ncbi:MAG: hypothetical protein CMM58_12280 [Rhodospirillaceae bacterium]|nr:hypothetical protein [Rhodospirillaceae bacterium]